MTQNPVTESDGRRLRGQERRRRLIEASLVVLEREGLAGLSHRAVAAEAGVALASATYHFEGIDDLALSAMLAATDEFTRSLRERPDRAGVSGYASALADELASHRGRVVAGYELYLLAARRPALHDAAVDWMQAGTEPLLETVDEVRRQAFLAVVNSVCLAALLDRDEPRSADIEKLLRHVLK